MSRSPSLLVQTPRSPSLPLSVLIVATPFIIQPLLRDPSHFLLCYLFQD